LTPHEKKASLITFTLYVVIFWAILLVFGGIGYGFYSDWDFLRDWGFLNAKSIDEPFTPEQAAVEPSEPDEEIGTNEGIPPIIPPPSPPQIMPTAQAALPGVDGKVTVSISGENGSELFYTTNGQDPVPYKEGTNKFGTIPVQVAPGTTVKAIATRSGQQSNVAEVYYSHVTTKEPAPPSDIKYVEGYDFTDGVAWVRERGKNYWQCIDKTGKILLKLEKGEAPASTFSHGVALVRRPDDVVELIDKTGKVISSPKFGEYDKITKFIHDVGMIFVHKHIDTFQVTENRVGVIDRNGKWQMPLTNDRTLVSPITKIVGGLMHRDRGRLDSRPGGLDIRTCLLDTQGGWSEGDQYRYCGEGVFVTPAGTARTAQFYNIMTDSRAKLSTYRSITPRAITNGYGVYASGGVVYAIDKFGESTRILGSENAITSATVGKYAEGLFYCNLGSEHGFYDISGNRIIDLSGYTLNRNAYVEEDYHYFSKGYCLLNLINPSGVGYYTILDRSGKIMFEPRKSPYSSGQMPPVYENLSVRCGMAVVRDGYSGSTAQAIINVFGETVVEFEGGYTVSNYSEDVALVEGKGEVFYLDQLGNRVGGGTTLPPGVKVFPARRPPPGQPVSVQHPVKPSVSDDKPFVPAKTDNKPGSGSVVPTVVIGKAATLRGHGKLVRSATFSPDSKYIVTASADKTARVWDVANGETKTVLLGNGHKEGVNYAAFSPDGMRIVTASDDKTARIWEANATKNNKVTVLSGHKENVLFAAFSPDGKRIVTASIDNTARIWDAASGRELLALRGHEYRVYTATFSSDGKRIVTASMDFTARVWDATSGKELLVLREYDGGGNGRYAYSAAFSPDDKYIVTAADNTARVWDAISGKEVTVLRGHGNEVNFATFSSDGKYIVTASRDKTARIWDVASGKELAVLRGHENDVKTATFSPDGKRIATTSFDETARIWDITIENK